MYEKWKYRQRPSDIELLDPTMPETSFLHFGAMYTREQIPLLFFFFFPPLRSSGILLVVTGKSLCRNQHSGNFYHEAGTILCILNTLFLLIFCLRALHGGHDYLSLTNWEMETE